MHNITKRRYNMNANTVNIKTLTLLDTANLGLFADDMFGDGIRLKAIREPSIGRLAALELVNNKQFVFDAEKLIHEEYDTKIQQLFNKRTGGLKQFAKVNL